MKKKKKWLVARTLLNLKDNSRIKIKKKKLWRCYTWFIGSLVDVFNSYYKYSPDDILDDARVIKHFERKTKRIIKRLKLIWKLCKIHIEHICNRKCTATIPLACPLYLLSTTQAFIMFHHKFRPLLAFFTFFLHKPEFQKSIKELETEIRQIAQSLPPHCTIYRHSKEISTKLETSFVKLFPLFSFQTIATMENILWWDAVGYTVYKRATPDMSPRGKDYFLIWQN